MVYNPDEKKFEKTGFAHWDVSNGEVWVKIVYATICTSDLHTVSGRRSCAGPCILGHEIIGEVVACADVDDYYGHSLQLGDLVTWSVYAYDAQDEMAVKGIPQKSSQLYKYGHEVLDEDQIMSGGFGSHCLLKEGTSIFKLSNNFSYKVAAPLNCSHATVAGSLRLAGEIKGRNVLVIGAGMIGLSASAMAVESGARNVVTTDIDDERLNRSRDFGVDLVLSHHLSNEDLEIALTDIGGIDIVIDTSGSPDAIEKWISKMNIGGTAVLIGSVFTQRDIHLNAEKCVRNLWTIRGLHNYMPQDLAYAIDFMENNHQRYPFDSLVKNEFKLSDIELAFTQAHRGEDYRVGVYVDQP